MKNTKAIAIATSAIIMLGGMSANAATTTSFKDATTALNTLKVATESRTGYVRTKFKHWDGAGNGCDARKAVIISEAKVKPTVKPGCVITGGEWLSIYDNVKVTDASKLDVDHMVPLAEAWDSGASAWTDAKREFYANDQTDPRHLIAVTGSSNRSKSDQDPADWLPTNKAYVCEYLTNWVSIKVRWNLSVDAKEKTVIANDLKSCKSTAFSVNKVN
ncbi:MAG: hypothetical protein RLZZ196_170 [Bacteroidota bacterium]|jgi:hypothetical protein